MKPPLITFYTNSFNRLTLLKNLLRSFEVCNTYKHVEWVITDYGSTDGSREWLQVYAPNAPFPVHYSFSDEQAYFFSLQLPQLDRRTKLEAILRFYRNQARQASHGDYFFDVASDHQFIRRGQWVEEIFEIFDHRKQTSGQDDISGIVLFGYFRWRLDKINNRRGKEQNTQSAPYYVAETKPYVDYSAMKRRTAERIGPYWELTKLAGNPELIARWYQQDAALHPESEYSRRAGALGLKRIFMKYPALISFRNREVAQLAPSPANNDLIVPLWTLENMQQQFGYLRRPISSDELCGMPTPSIWAKLRALV